MPPQAPSPPPASQIKAPTAKCICKPSQHILDIIAPHLTVHLILPSPEESSYHLHCPQLTNKPQLKYTKGRDKQSGLWAADFIDKYSMLAEMSDKEAFEPRSLTKAKHHPDWLLWEKAIKEELETLQITGTWELT